MWIKRRFLLLYSLPRENLNRLRILLERAEISVEVARWIGKKRRKILSLSFSLSQITNVNRYSISIILVSRAQARSILFESYRNHGLNRRRKDARQRHASRHNVTNEKTFDGREWYDVYKEETRVYRTNKCKINGRFHRGSTKFRNLWFMGLTSWIHLLLPYCRRIN